MNCPVCNVELEPTDRGGAEVDYCPQCRGVWVAREELDRILAQPTPFDLDWDEDGDELLDGDRVVLALNDNPSDRRPVRPGFWTSLFDAGSKRAPVASRTK